MTAGLRRFGSSADEARRSPRALAGTAASSNAIRARWKILCFLVSGFLCATSLSAEFFSIGPDASFIPRGFTSITETGTVTPLFDLGDGSLALNGGLAYRGSDGLFYGIANDFSGNSSLVSFSLLGGGALTTIGTLGPGFSSGLAYNSADDLLYAISNDWMGLSTLHSIDFTGSLNVIGSLGVGFYGGLTFRPSDGKLYAFAADSWGAQRRFMSVDPGSAAATELFELGAATISFNGGVAYNSHDGRFYTISNDMTGSSELWRFALAGPGSLSLGSGIGGGFWNVGLAEKPAAVPEPGSWGTAAAALALLMLRLRRWQRWPAHLENRKCSLKEK